MMFKATRTSGVELKEMKSQDFSGGEKSSGKIKIQQQKFLAKKIWQTFFLGGGGKDF